MSKNLFEKSVEFVLKSEGGYVNNPADPGGETNFGISKRAYPNVDIKNLTRESAIKIYETDYWFKSGADKLPWPLCLVHFDSAVQHGNKRANDLLMSAKNDWRDYLILRIKFYNDIKNKTFLSGWINRCISLLETCNQ